MRKTLAILLIVFTIALFVNIYVIVKYIGKVLTIEATAYGNVSLTIISQCGDGVCAGETCSSCPADCGTCAAPPAAAPTGGGVTEVVTRDFSIDQAFIKVMVKQGESFKTSINIKNTEKISQKFDLSVSPSLKDFIFLSEYSFTLNAGEEKTIYLTFVSTDETKPDVYTGNLQVSTQYLTKKVPITFNVKSKIVLFDLSLDIPAKYKEILPGEELLLQVSLFNLGETGKTDVSINYIIKDFEGKTITEQSEIVAVETQVSFSKMIKLPSDMKIGDYVAIAQARYDDSIGSSSVMFHIIEKEKPEIVVFMKSKYFFIILAIVILAIFLIILLEYERRKMKDILETQAKEIQQINERLGKGKKRIVAGEAVEIKGKLTKQLIALEKAYKAGYITHKSYEKGKVRILNLNKKIKEKCL